MWSIFRDGPEFTTQNQTPFRPTKVTLAELHDCVPKHLFNKNTLKAMGYLLRSLVFSFLVYRLGWMIDPLTSSVVESSGIGKTPGFLVKWSLWGLYWHWQGVIFAGFWCMAHEASHGSLSNHRGINHVVGFLLHIFLFAPYFSWRATHQAHHKATMSVERDENYVPRTRTDYGLPPESGSRESDYHDVFEETPIYTLAKMFWMQALGWQSYLVTNTMGSAMYPPGTNRGGVILSDIGLAFMSLVLYMWIQSAGVEYFFKLYFVPYVLANHWMFMLTYLHHSDPSIPHYRNGQWSFLRGALATVDRPFLGWAGRFILHNVSHDHVTEAIKQVLQDDYNYDSTNTFRALYRTFTQCCFIEDDADIVFYKNKDGKSSRVRLSR